MSKSSPSGGPNSSTRTKFGGRTCKAACGPPVDPDAHGGGARNVLTMPPRTDPDPHQTLAYVGLGSNLDDPAARIMQALGELKSLPKTRLLQHSSLFGNPPMGPPNQPDYVNAVAELETALSAHALLRCLQDIEFGIGRVRGGERWGPRIIDLDLLVYGQEQIEDDTLIIPHPGIAERAFVLYPLAEIAPDLIIPGSAAVRDLAAKVSPDGLMRLAINGEN